MKKTIIALYAASLCFSTLAMAETGGRIEEFKQKLIQHVDSEIAILGQFKACIQTAKSQADFEVCKNAKNEAQKKKMVEMRKEHLENQKKQIAIEEKQLNDAEKAAKK